MTGYIKQTRLEDESEAYRAFVQKFKPKKTTDDCYTLPAVFDAVRDFAVAEYGLQGRELVRPFYPGGDYERYAYPPGCVVLDNPPFSILSQIVRHYQARSIDYFLFAPTLQLFSIGRGTCNYILCDTTITYANGAKVNTSFVTNLGPYKIASYQRLTEAIRQANAQRKKKESKKIELPPQVITAARLGVAVRAGAEIRIRSARFTGRMDDGYNPYGGAFYISSAAAEHIHAGRIRTEREVEQHSLSQRELDIIKALDQEDEAHA